MTGDKNNNTPANIHKLDAKKAVREAIPYTTLSTKVLQNLKDAECLAVWCYLQSMPPQWNVIKENIRKHFNWGVNKIDSVFSNLKKKNLIEYVRDRNSDGTLGEVRIVIKNGEAFTDDSTTHMETMCVDSTTTMETMRVENHAHGFQGTINTISNINTTEPNKDIAGDMETTGVKITPAEKALGDSPSANTPRKKVSDYEKDESFMRFYKAYPKHEKPRDAWKAFKSVIGDNDALLEEVLADIALRISEHTQWQDKQYIPYPATYLRSDAWKGEIYNKAKALEERRIHNELEAKKRMAEHERLSQQRREQEQSKSAQYAQDRKMYRAITEEVKKGNVSKPSADFKALAAKLSGKS